MWCGVVGVYIVSKEQLEFLTGAAASCKMSSKLLGLLQITFQIIVSRLS